MLEDSRMEFGYHTDYPRNCNGKRFHIMHGVLEGDSRLGTTHTLGTTTLAEQRIIKMENADLLIFICLNMLLRFPIKAGESKE